MTDKLITLGTVIAELRALGITIESRPGEYRVNIRNGSERTAIYSDDLHHALEAGHAMAATVADRTVREKIHRAVGESGRPPRRMKPKSLRRRMMREHNRRVRARALKRTD
jgi:predicted DNA-binding transcriptional regulator YafY